MIGPSPKEVTDAAYPPTLPARVPGRGGAPRPGQRQVAPGAGGRPGRLVGGVAPLAAARCRRRGSGPARRGDDGRAGGTAPPAPRGEDAPAGAGDPPKSGGLLREGDPVSRYRFIHAERANYPVTLLCRV